MKKAIIITHGETEHLKEYARSTPEQRLRALFDIQSHWIKNDDKLVSIDSDYYLDFIKIVNSN